MTVSDIGRELARLLQQAMDCPEQVDRHALLSASSAFLDVARAPELPGLTMARGMAFRAMEWCTMDRPEDYAALRRAIGIFSMHAALTN